ncbi:pyridoxal 5'-phosphate synthase glutaminase subunit PdxT [Lysinibacillus sp. KU-BSD001]|uniref:pyridoxal 5'-phosphate synthase glutaminase subunit PdxT n=1 Tax=Lysinibacillus sp. KU-BSD001 TaxID=3141328 RepID=UPI0036E28703
MKIGVLALQGAVTEHIKAIEACGSEAVPIKTAAQLQDIDGLLLPGGESTAMRRLIDYANMLPALQQFAENKPVFGTCAGLILLASSVEEEEAHIGQMRITARRNAFGRQIDSFETPIAIQGVSDHFPAVFIRAPKIAAVEEQVEVLAVLDGDIVCARDRHLLACSFHPELTTDLSLMNYFIDMCK